MTASKASAPTREYMHCGHEVSFLIRSAETGDALYCEICNLRDERNDAVQMEQELRAQLSAATARAAEAEEKASEQARCAMKGGAELVAMAKRAAEAEAKVEDWNEEWPGGPSQVRDSCRRYREISVERTKRAEAAELDAGRYRWLRSNVEQGGDLPRDMLLVYQGPTSDHSLLAEELDSAIDAALRRSAP